MIITKEINCKILKEGELFCGSWNGKLVFDELMRIRMIRYYKNYPNWTPVNDIFYDEDKKVLHLLEEMIA